MRSMQQDVTMLLKALYKPDNELFKKCREPDWVAHVLKQEEVDLNILLHLSLCEQNDTNTAKIHDKLSKYLERWNEE